jgi:putative tricarboxylic transport membrane protein
MSQSLTRRDFLKISGGTLAGATVLGLAGCGGGGSDQDQQGDGGGSAWEPSENVVVIVPFAAGGGSDLFGRSMASGIEEVRSDLNVNVENRVGGSGAVGYSYLLEQAGDPHFLLASEPAVIALPLTQDTPFELSDFTPIAQLAEDATLLVTGQDSSYQSLSDVIDAAEEGQVKVGISGVSGLDNIVMTLVEEETGVSFQRVVFGSGGELVTSLLSGDIDIASLNPGEVIGQIESGDMRALVVFADDPYEGEPLANVPTAKDEGVDVSFTQWRGALGAGEITDAQRQYWIDTLTQWTETEDYNSYINDNFLLNTVRTGQEFQEYLTGYAETVEKVLSRQEG